MVIGLGKVYEVIKRVPVVPDVLESNHALQAPLQQDSGGDACVVPALKCKFLQNSEIAKFVTTILFSVLVNNIRSLTLRDGPGMSQTERQTQGHRRRWSFPAKAIRVRVRDYDHKDPDAPVQDPNRLPVSGFDPERGQQ